MTMLGETLPLSAKNRLTMAHSDRSSSEGCPLYNTTDGHVPTAYCTQSVYHMN